MNPSPSWLTALTGRYVIEREIGAGGMANVFLARDVRHEQNVALKVFRPELAASGSERFPREIRIVAQLQHPHILTLIDSGEVAGQLYYVMPYVAGGTLRTRLARDGTLPLEDAVKIACESNLAPAANAHRRPQAN